MAHWKHLIRLIKQPTSHRQTKQENSFYVISSHRSLMPWIAWNMLYFEAFVVLALNVGKDKCIIVLWKGFTSPIQQLKIWHCERWMGRASPPLFKRITSAVLTHIHVMYISFRRSIYNTVCTLIEPGPAVSVHERWCCDQSSHHTTPHHTRTDHTRTQTQGRVRMFLISGRWNWGRKGRTSGVIPFAIYDLHMGMSEISL